MAGAVQVVADGGTIKERGHYEPLSVSDVAAHVLRAPHAGLGLDRDRGIRLSLAGVQDKVVLHRSGGQFHLPINGAPSTVIIKPEPRNTRDGALNFPGLATNELYCLTLAGLCGLDVADATVEHFDTVPALVVDRYDRYLRDGRVERLHQEDLLSALGRDPLHKYETPRTQRVADQGGWGETATRVTVAGPTLRDLAGLIGTHLGVARVVPFLEAVAFNIVIGNADAHARNYSLILPPDGDVRIAPLYDLVSTRMWDRLDRDAAQKVNGVDTIDEITEEDLVAEAASWGIPARLARVRVRTMIAAVIGQADACVGRTIDRGGDPAVAGHLRADILQRARRVSR